MKFGVTCDIQSRILTLKFSLRQHLTYMCVIVMPRSYDWIKVVDSTGCIKWGMLGLKNIRVKALDVQQYSHIFVGNRMWPSCSFHFFHFENFVDFNSQRAVLAIDNTQMYMYLQLLQSSCRQPMTNCILMYIFDYTGTPIKKKGTEKTHNYK